MVLLESEVFAILIALKNKAFFSSKVFEKLLKTLFIAAGFSVSKIAFNSSS